jgi:xanthine dehydrogenase small subunit
MAGTPKRATHVEGALIGQTWSLAAVKSCQQFWDKDFTPLSDMRASSAYRLKSAQNLLQRYYLESTGEARSVLEVSA